MKKITDFRDIKRFPRSAYHVDIGWDYLETQISDEEEIGLDLNPDFQRAHVWNEQQQIDYCEYVLRGGTSGKELYFNCVGWGEDYRGPFVIVDGKQRMEAVRAFMRGDIKVFGSYIHEYKAKPDMLTARFSWNVSAIATRAEVLEWYLNFNAGGTVHTEQELQKVRDMMGDGLHHEPDGKWISIEYKKVLRALGIGPKKRSNTSQNNKAMANRLKDFVCLKCDGVVKQTRSGSLRAVCVECGAKYQALRRK